ncbi:MAG: EamA family transporter, partial [Patescibacteria group bacterium]
SVLVYMLFNSSPNLFLSHKIGLLSGLFLTTGSIAFFYSAGRVGNVLILIVIAACSPLVASLLSAIYDQEKLGYLKRVGAALAVIGIVLLNVIK